MPGTHGHDQYYSLGSSVALLDSQLDGIMICMASLNMLFNQVLFFELGIARLSLY